MLILKISIAAGLLNYIITFLPVKGCIVGCHLPADIFARYCRSAGYDTTFVGGSDMHGTPAMITAQEKGMKVEDLTAKLHAVHDKIYKKLCISYDIYSHTNTDIHIAGVAKTQFFSALLKTGLLKWTKFAQHLLKQLRMLNSNQNL